MSFSTNMQGDLAIPGTLRFVWRKTCWRISPCHLGQRQKRVPNERDCIQGLTLWTEEATGAGPTIFIFRLKRWSERQDLNLRRLGPKPSALARLSYAPMSWLEVSHKARGEQVLNSSYK